MSNPFERMVQAQPIVVTEEILTKCNFGFVKAEAPDGRRYFVFFDVPLGPGAVRRVTVPFDSIAFANFIRQAREASGANGA